MTETLIDALSAVVARGPGRPAVRAGGTAWTYGELWDRSERVASSLLARLHVPPGTRIGILGHNDPGYLAAYFGILRAGCVAVPLNQLLLPVEIAAQLELVGSDVCLLGQIDASTAASVGARIRTIPISDLRERVPATLPPVAADDDATILLTSGTTGTPKGAVHTHATMRHAIAEMHRCLPFSADDVMLGFLPFFAAIPEQIVPTLLAGGSLEILPRFDLEEVADACGRATTLDAVPTILARMLDAIDHARLARLRWIMFASEPMPPPLLARWWEALPGVRTYEFYGMTEMLTITVATPETLRAVPASVGVPFPSSRVAIIDAEGRPAPPGESGEVICASPARMRDYLPEGIDPMTWRTPDGAMRTGDLARFDGAGHLILTGRIKDLIISGGLNIAPSEIEAVAVTHPAVAAALVVGVPDPRWGETPIVVAIAKRGADLTPQDLLAHCRANLASYKRPTGAALVDQFPLTGIGKSSKAQLRDEIVAGRLGVEHAG